MADINVRSTGTHGRGETFFDREITEAQYMRAVQKHHGYLTREEQNAILTDSERFGYGASCGRVFEQDGKFYVHVSMSNSCD